MITSPNLAQMSSAALQQYLILAQQENQKREDEIVSIYERLFSSIIGCGTLFDLPIVSLTSLGVDEAKYPEGIKPSMMNEHSAVRGMMESGRPFVAIKIQIVEATTQKVIAVGAVEFVFKRYSKEGGLKGRDEDNYVTSPTIRSEGGTQYASTLYSTGGMSTKQMQAVKALLDGKEIKAPIKTHGNYLIKKV